MTPKNPARKRRAPTAASLKRELAAVKQENRNLKAQEPQMAQNPDLAEANPGLRDVNPGLVEDHMTEERPPKETDLFMDAKNNRFVLNPTFETEEQTVGQDRPREMKSTGPAKESLESSSIEGVDRPVSKEKLAMLAFMEEVLIVMVHDTTNERDIPVPPVWNDGRAQYFIRGVEQKVKRKFIEVLARAKKTSFTQEMYKDAMGNDGYRQIPHTALAYPFSVLHDPHPRGKDWLKSILSEA